MSSTVIAIPSGPIQDWCIMVPWFDPNATPQQCANATLGTKDSDFQTICCDGQIVDMKVDIYHNLPFADRHIDLADLVCCRLQGPQAGGFMPLYDGAATQCSTGTPVPLESLAATSTNVAQGYLVTYTSASFGESTVGNFVPTQTPYCLWAYTASGVALTNITVPAAQITTLSSTSYLVGTVDTGSTTSIELTTTTRISSSAAKGSSSTSSSTTSHIFHKGMRLQGLLWASTIIISHCLLPAIISYA